LRAPEASFCANHSELAPDAERLPIGPIWRLTENELAIEGESADSNAVRNRLLNLVERIHVRSASDLTYRERSVLWQLERFGERRARPHLDRIRSDLQRSGRARIWLPYGAELLEAPIEAIVGGGPDGAARESLLDSLTFAGRALLVVSLLIGAGTALAVGWALLGAADPAARGSRWWKVPLFSGMAAAGVVLTVGGRVLPARGYELRAREPQDASSTRSTDRSTDA
jgi:hypothetical protein